jgi:hypothetical protein
MMSVLPPYDRDAADLGREMDGEHTVDKYIRPLCAGAPSIPEIVADPPPRRFLDPESAISMA